MRQCANSIVAAASSCAADTDLHLA